MVYGVYVMVYTYMVRWYIYNIYHILYIVVVYMFCTIYTVYGIGIISFHLTLHHSSLHYLHGYTTIWYSSNRYALRVG